MGIKKEKTKQVAVRLPLTLHDFVSNRAVRIHGGDFTAAMIELLSQVREVLIERDAWIAQQQLIGWAKKWEEKKPIIQQARERKAKSRNQMPGAG